MKTPSFSPKTFLKNRRPERFSDTIFEQATELDRSLLEFHLSSLTIRSQETDFEHFARRLCEREICPNLLPQTGPTGGGDSKVDSETYPVADNLALAWYVGNGREAAKERWAFAFSAKADWMSKVRSDIAKIAGTKRGYAKAFFVTNQAVPDRKRAQVEDALRDKHHIDVRILDRTWILDRVFQGGHEELTVHELRVTAISRREIKKGPLDVKREGRLEETEARIHEAIQSGSFGPALVEDALDVADFARELERPRAEIEGRYIRADQLALKYGTPRQQVEAAYQRAWTLFWWFEDYDAFVEQYGIVEARVHGSRNSYDLERLSNLWSCLYSIVVRGTLDEQSTSYHIHTEALIAELERLRTEQDRPSTALQAETFLLKVQLACRLAAEEPVEAILRSLQDVVLRSEGLVGYPLKPLVESITESGHVLEGIPGYDELFETLVKVISSREGEVSGARLLLARGKRQLFLERPVEAIATLGLTFGPLHKHETRYDIVQALYFCGCAYEHIGLLWAARGTFLAAASIAADELWRYGDVTPYQAACYRQLKWIELRLGRLPHILAWCELDRAVHYVLAERGYDAEETLVADPVFDGLLIRLLLRTDFFDLKALQKLPDVLDRLGLELAADALLYALGHSERLKKVAAELGEDLDVFARKGRNIQADVPLPDYPVLYNQRKVLLQSQVLGCRIIIESQTDFPCVEVAESLLAVLESFLATSDFNRAIAREPELTVQVRTSDFIEIPISVSVEERAGRPHLVVRCRSFDPHNMPIDEQVAARHAVFQVAVTALAHTISFRNVEHDLEALFRDERIAERAVAFTSTFGTQANVLGAVPKTRLPLWIGKEEKAYPLLRTEPWSPREDSNESEQDGMTSGSFVQDTEPPPELLDPNLRSHNQITTISLIRERLWNRAGWSGTVFLTDVTNASPPVFGFIFRDHEAGREIFTHWRTEFGKVDIQEQIRLTVVRGIDQAHPHAYRVVIGSNPNNFPAGTRFAAFVHRSHRMDARTSDNLDRFLNAYAIVGAFLIAPAFAPLGFDGSQVPEVGRERCIGIHHIHVRNAWEIGLNDIDAIAIHPTDDPIIPQGMDVPPVSALIRSRRDG